MPVGAREVALEGLWLQDHLCRLSLAGHSPPSQTTNKTERLSTVVLPASYIWDKIAGAHRACTRLILAAPPTSTNFQLKIARLMYREVSQDMGNSFLQAWYASLQRAGRCVRAHMLTGCMCVLRPVLCCAPSPMLCAQVCVRAHAQACRLACPSKVHMLCTHFQRCARACQGTTELVPGARVHQPSNAAPTWGQAAGLQAGHVAHLARSHPAGAASTGAHQTECACTAARCPQVPTWHNHVRTSAGCIVTGERASIVRSRSTRSARGFHDHLMYTA